MNNPFKTKYRIVKDDYCGFEAQHKRWWFPFYTQMGYFGNTHMSIEAAKRYIRKQQTEVVWEEE